MTFDDDGEVRVHDTVHNIVFKPIYDVVTRIKNSCTICYEIQLNGVFAVETTLKFFYYCLTSDSIKMTVNTTQWVRRVQKRNFGSWISLDFVVLVNSLGFK